MRINIPIAINISTVKAHNSVAQHNSGQTHAQNCVTVSVQLPTLLYIRGASYHYQKKGYLMSALQQLRTMTTIVADTGDLSAIARLKPIDATTNPSLITKAMIHPDNQGMLSETMSRHNGDVDAVIDALTIQVGCDILELIEGRVSTEVDARLSYDTGATIDKALAFMDAYQKAGVNSERVLIKMAATWQGIEAARYLETQGIHCNLTLLFGQHQAIACADAGVTLISPFVGRILDWQKRQQNRQNVPASDDMGVQSVKLIYQYYKQPANAKICSVERKLAPITCVW